MINTRNHYGWLNHRVERYLKVHHADLIADTSTGQFRSAMEKICARKGWWKIMLIVLIAFSFCMLFPLEEILHLVFKPENKSIATLIDQRTSNLATIVGMILTVTGLVISNMAVKESYAYEVLFAKSRLYGIIYFVLSTIGLLIVISCLRDTVGEKLFNRMVIVGTLFVLFILVLIALLFRSMINFTNVKAIDKIYRDYLLIQEKKNLLAALRVKYSAEQFKNLLAKYKAIEYTFSHAFEDSPHLFSMSVIDYDTEPSEEPHLQVIDINMTQLAYFMDEKKKEGQIYFQRLQLDALTNQRDNYIWVKGRSNAKEEKKVLKSSLVLKQVKETPTETQLNARKYFDEKLEERTEDGKMKGIEQILDSYLDMYMLEMKNSDK